MNPPPSFQLVGCPDGHILPEVYVPGIRVFKVKTHLSCTTEKFVEIHVRLEAPCGTQTARTTGCTSLPS